MLRVIGTDLNMYMISMGRFTAARPREKPLEWLGQALEGNLCPLPKLFGRSLDRPERPSDHRPLDLNGHRTACAHGGIALNGGDALQVN